MLYAEHMRKIKDEIKKLENIAKQEQFQIQQAKMLELSEKERLRLEKEAKIIE